MCLPGPSVLICSSSRYCTLHIQWLLGEGSEVEVGGHEADHISIHCEGKEYWSYATTSLFIFMVCLIMHRQRYLTQPSSFHLVLRYNVEGEDLNLSSHFKHLRELR
jgi:hypothetical protein